MFEDLDRIVVFYMVERGESGMFLGYDNRGALATGYPAWVQFRKAERYNTYDEAQAAWENFIKLTDDGGMLLGGTVRKMVCKILDGHGEKVYF